MKADAAVTTENDVVLGQCTTDFDPTGMTMTVRVTAPATVVSGDTLSVRLGTRYPTNATFPIFRAGTATKIELIPVKTKYKYGDVVTINGQQLLVIVE